MTTTTPLTEAGWALVQAPFSLEQLDELDREVAYWERQAAAGTDEHRVAYDEQGRILVANRLDVASDFLFDFARSPEMVGQAEHLLGLAIVPLHVETFTRPSGAGVGPAHQDHAFYHEHFTDEVALSIWIPFDEVAVDGGTLGYATDRERVLLEHVPSASADFALELRDPGRFSYTAAAVPRGWCLAHDSMAVHRSHENVSGRDRRAVAFNYRTSAYRQGLRERQARAGQR